MSRGSLSFRVGHAGAAGNAHRSGVRRDSCSTGGFIVSPSSGEEVDTSNPVTFAWDSSCLNVTAADIYLYAPYQQSTLVQIFHNVDFSLGSYNTTLKPKWWNSTSSVNLQLNIVDAGTPAFLATLPAGPIWTANYNASEASSSDAGDVGTVSSSDSNVTQVNNLDTKNGVLSKGAVAAAVLIPLIVIGIALGIYVKYSRARESVKRKRWSEAVDKRMSVVSVDWRSMSAKGAEAAIRASMVDPNRSSMWTGPGAANVDAPPHPSAFATDGSITQPEMAQIRTTGVGLRGPIPSMAGGAGRVSRVSFAADTRFSRVSVGDALAPRARPSAESRRSGVMSRAFHSAYIPPVPAISRLSEYVPDGEAGAETDSEENRSGVVSPIQREGAHDLSVDEIHLRMSEMKSNSVPRLSLGEAMPALSMVLMASDSPMDPMFPMPITMPIPNPAAQSPILPALDVQPPLADAMSPDKMMRVYAERRRTGGSVMFSPPGTPSPVTFPMPVISAGPITNPRISWTSPNGAVSLDEPVSAAATTRPESAFPESFNNPFRKSTATHYHKEEEEDDDDNVYFGVAE
ncbi:hypothetical protein M0805_000448 [Coniferiporia weirii]|nr:hypothetical protein M0805_000448 [Coniferiporia weirii]